MLTEQYSACQPASMIRGELEIILTAMKTRAAQLKDNDDTDDEDDEQNEDDEDSGEDEDEDGGDGVKKREEPEQEVEESKLQFPNERRFPVLLAFSLLSSQVALTGIDFVNNIRFW